MRREAWYNGCVQTNRRGDINFAGGASAGRRESHNEGICDRWFVRQLSSLIYELGNVSKTFILLAEDLDPSAVLDIGTGRLIGQRNAGLKTPKSNPQHATGIDFDGGTSDGSDEGSQGRNQGKDPHC